MQRSIYTAILLALCAFRVPAASSGPKDAERFEASDAFFADPAVRVFDLHIPESAIAQLTRAERAYVSANLTEGETVLNKVGVRLKGMSSFRDIRQKPSFAVKFDEFVEGQTYQGLKKLMFNNSVQDRTYLSELLGTRLFQEAGVPAARVTYARMRLNGRDLGVYVLVEAMNKDFLKRQFGSGKGNLYEAFLQDVNGQVEQDSGEDETRADLAALVEACAIADAATRWKELGKLLDIDRFLSFIAMEMLTTHWDGYSVHFNNYRLYHDPGTGKMVFITHGLDSLFRRPDCAIVPPLTSLVGTAVLTTPEGRKLYDERIRKLAREVFRVPVIMERMDAALARIRGAVLDSTELTRIDRFANLMRERIQRRSVRVDEQFHGKKPITIRFSDNGVGTPVSWRDEPDRGDPAFDQPKLEERETLHIGVREESTRASWRSQVFLQPGSYRFEGMVRTSAVASGTARLRVSGDSASTGVTGTSPWRSLRHDFVVERDGMDIELICELNARQRDVWFDAGSLHVTRIDTEKLPETDRLRLLKRPQAR